MQNQGMTAHSLDIHRVQHRAQQSSARRRGSADARLRQLVAAILLLAVLLGVRSGPRLSWSAGWRGPWHDGGHAVVMAAALELVCGGLIVALRSRAKRTPAPGQPAVTLRAVLVPVIAAAMVAAPAALVLLVHLKLSAEKPRPRYSPSSQKVPHVAPAPPLVAEIIKYLIAFLVLVLTALLVGAVVRLVRRVRFGAGGRAVADDADDDAAALGRAVEAGRLALGELGEPRMAIINCYLAMERSLAAAGAARTGAETPLELLARSRAAGLLHSIAADELTGLFYAARFSTHPVGREAIGQARRALTEIAAELAAAAGQLAAPP
jgi:hypothetical protein